MTAPFKCILLSGLSGSGKSTAGPLVAAALPNCVFVEGDAFYREKKPTVALSTGEIVANWDSADALDWSRINDEVASRLRRSNVILATFLPRVDLMSFPVARHIHLAFDPRGSSQGDIVYCIAARLASKRFAGAARLRDELMVREVVYSVYTDTIARYPADATVYVYADVDRERRPIQSVVDEILLYVHKLI